MHAGRMPRLMRLHKEAGNSSVLVRFVADPPTTTMQRLKATLTVSIPHTPETIGNEAVFLPSLMLARASRRLLLWRTT
ncbi:unnamed protein product [Ostreobium quekettii]|uniref:Uncharacterized protein n=1 Tax=Ostreobium quekettii TaxID=121088 RepID=A0A8S1JBZ5_9CHLO|nr:unnamed protein product [Ostreobium quekettii]